MSDNVIVSIIEEGKYYDKSEYFSAKQILDHNYQDKLKYLNISSDCSLNWSERMRLANNIHQVRKIFSEHTDNTISSMWINVFNTGKLDIDKFKEAVEMRPSQTDWKPYWKSNIHVRFGDVQDKVLVYSWLDINQQFNQDKWNNLLSQLEGDYKINLIGTGPFTFKYKDLSYRVYPPLFGSSDDEESSLNDPEVFNFSPTEVNKIIEDIKESHQSIKKKIAKSLGKDFAENNEGYIKIKADIDKTSSVKNFTDVSYISRGNKQIQIEEAFVKDDIGGNLLHSYVYENKEAVMKYMFNLRTYDNNSINAVNANGKTPLHLAVKYGREGMVKMLLNKGAKVDIADNRGRTPLHLAAQNNNKEILGALIKAEGINVNAVDEDGKTPLQLAAENDYKDVVEALLDKNANISITNQDGYTLLHWAAVKGHKDVVETLLKKGADVNAVSRHKNIPLHLAAAKGHKEVVEALLKVNGINVNAEDKDGNTPFDLTTNEEIKALFKKAAEDPDAGSVAKPSTDSKGDQEGDAQTEEQPSSFFGSLFSILMKPFSLIASFFGGFFSWLFGSDTDESTSQTYARCEEESSSCDYDVTKDE